MVKGRKARGVAVVAAQQKKQTSANLLVNTLLMSADGSSTNHYTFKEDSCFNSPKRKETKLESKKILCENGYGIVLECEARPSTRSTRKINDYFPTVNSNKDRNGRQSSDLDIDENTCDSIEDSTDAFVTKATNFSNILQQSTYVIKQQPQCKSSAKLSKQQKLTFGDNNPTHSETNLFLQEPVLTLGFDKTVTNTPIAAIDDTNEPTKKSFLCTDNKLKFQALPPTEYINKVLNVHDLSAKLNQKEAADDVVSTSESPTRRPPLYLLSSASNSTTEEQFETIDLRSPINNLSSRRRKPTTPHRILCPSPVKGSSPPLAIEHSNAEKVEGARKNDFRKKLIHTEQNGHISFPKPLVAVPLPEKKTVTASEVGTNKKVTEFFPVRRSVRKTKKEVQEERSRQIERCIRDEREDGLAVKTFEQKGRGIVTTRKFLRHEFVIEYIGDLISMQKANEREQIYAQDDSTGCYMYYFKHNDQQYCIDATRETGKMGRLVNHSRNGNLITKTVFLKNRPHLVLIAKDDLEEGVEVTYDYGDRSKEALQHHPWLAL